MNEVIQQGLMITAIGMGLVFAVIIFLWGMMVLLVWVTTPKSTNKPTEEDVDDVETADSVTDMAAVEKQRRAAAAAVAVGLAIAQSRPITRGIQAQLGTMSPWQSVHRSQQFFGQRKRG